MHPHQRLLLTGLLIIASPLIASGTLPLKMSGKVIPTVNPPTAISATVRLERADAPDGAREDFGACRTGGGAMEYHEAHGTITASGTVYTIVGVCEMEQGTASEIHTIHGGETYQFVGNVTQNGLKKQFVGQVYNAQGRSPYRFNFTEE